MPSHHILIIDDDRAVCSSLQLLLSKQGYTVKSLYYPQEIEVTIQEFKPDLVILDMNFTIETSGKQGLRALELILNTKPDTKVILMTGWATVQLAVEGMKKGAKDFIAKPWDNHSLLSSVKTIFELHEENIAKRDINITSENNGIVGQSRAIQELLDKATRIARTDASVLITGESGTGKELLAEMIHLNSPRKNQDFVKVNLGGISQSLFESELFGHKKGAFTGAVNDRIGRFEKADKGTIFLDEIGELEMASQVKLLRVLQEKTYERLGSSQPVKTDVRVICATNRDLSKMIEDNTFREDLYYRINIIQLHIPSLSERKEDIPILSLAFRDRVCTSYGLDLIPIDTSALTWLQNQAYPGNIRQLRNIIERTILFHIGEPKLEIKHFIAHFSSINQRKETISLPAVGKITLEEMEIQMIKKTLEHYHHSISESARSLGITRSALYRRLEKYHLHEDQN
jgi:two-component system, NtrC family, response regulator